MHLRCDDAGDAVPDADSTNKRVGRGVAKQRPQEPPSEQQRSRRDGRRQAAERDNRQGRQECVSSRCERQRAIEKPWCVSNLSDVKRRDDEPEPTPEGIQACATHQIHKPHDAQNAEECYRGTRSPWLCHDTDG